MKKKEEEDGQPEMLLEIVVGGWVDKGFASLVSCSFPMEHDEEERGGR